MQAFAFRMLILTIDLAAAETFSDSNVTYSLLDTFESETDTCALITRVFGFSAYPFATLRRPSSEPVIARNECAYIVTLNNSNDQGRNLPRGSHAPRTNFHLGIFPVTSFQLNWIKIQTKIFKIGIG